MLEADINCRADLVAWLIQVRDALDGPDAKPISRDCWIQAWADAIGYARALGLRDKLQPFGEPMQYPTYVIDLAILEKDIRDELRERVDNLFKNLTGERTPDGKADGKKNSWPVTPENPKVAQLAKRIRDNPDPQRTKTDIAREFTEHDERKAQSLLRKLRDYPHLLNGADG